MLIHNVYVFKYILCAYVNVSSWRATREIFTNEFNELGRVLYYVERKFPFSIFVENNLLYVFPNS